MKKHFLFYTFALVLATSAVPSIATAKNGGERESRMLMHLLEMEDAELAKLRQTVERIEAMSPKERSTMRQRLGKLQKMDPERREALRERFEAIPKEKREAMRKKWMEMSPEERREWRKKLREMSLEERADAIDNAGIMPPKGKARKKDNQGSPEGRKGPPEERRGPPPPLD